MTDADTAPAPTTTREDWFRLALDILVSEGVQKVSVKALAAALGVSRSSFYWFYRNRGELLDRLLDHWRETNTRAIVDHAARPAPTITGAVLGLFECWMDERRFDPRLDFAVREWSRRSGRVRRVVDQADDARIAAIAAMFAAHGYGAEDAFIRARVIYFMQIGYYALELREDIETRVGYVRAYLRAFTGHEPVEAEIGTFEAFAARLAAGGG